MRIGLHFWLFLLRKKSASIAFWYQNAACRENPAPNMPPTGGGLTVELWHKSGTHIGAAICSAAWGALCRCVRFYGPTAHPCRSALHKRRVRPPCGTKSKGWHQASSRLTNRMKEMIHDSVTQPNITRKIPSASAMCARYHGRNAVSISTRYTSGMDSLSFIAIRISKSSMEKQAVNMNNPPQTVCRMLTLLAAFCKYIF